MGGDGKPFPKTSLGLITIRQRFLYMHVRARARACVCISIDLDDLKEIIVRLKDSTKGGVTTESLQTFIAEWKAGSLDRKKLQF